MSILMLSKQLAYELIPSDDKQIQAVDEELNDLFH